MKRPMRNLRGKGSNDFMIVNNIYGIVVDQRIITKEMDVYSKIKIISYVAENKSS